MRFAIKNKILRCTKKDDWTNSFLIHSPNVDPIIMEMNEISLAKIETKGGNWQIALSPERFCSVICAETSECIYLFPGMNRTAYLKYFTGEKIFWRVINMAGNVYGWFLKNGKELERFHLKRIGNQYAEVELTLAGECRADAGILAAIGIYQLKMMEEGLSV